MENLLTEQVHVCAKLKGIEKMFTNLTVLQDDADSFVEAVNGITQSSENVCGKIRQLDVARVCLLLKYGFVLTNLVFLRRIVHLNANKE